MGQPLTIRGRAPAPRTPTAPVSAPATARASAPPAARASAPATAPASAPPTARASAPATAPSTARPSTAPGRKPAAPTGRPSRPSVRRATRRTKQLEEVAEALPQRASALSKIFLTRTTIPVSRTEVGVLRCLKARPRRITELAAEERVTQPGITLLVNRLAERGWVERTTDPSDRRAVLVTLTPAGEEVFDRLKAEYRALLHEEMASLTDHEVETLADAVGILDRLIGHLRQTG